jgi:hypothetical protein
MHGVIRSTLGVLAAVAALAASAPAEADRYHRHGGSSVTFGFSYYDPYPPGYYYQPYYYRARPVYVAPPPVYYAPPPPVVYDPPVTYSAPPPAFQSDGNCREYQSTVNVGGQAQQMVGTACQQPDGSWRIVR